MHEKLCDDQRNRRNLSKSNGSSVQQRLFTAECKSVENTKRSLRPNGCGGSTIHTEKISRIMISTSSHSSNK